MVKEKKKWVKEKYEMEKNLFVNAFTFSSKYFWKQNIW